MLLVIVIQMMKSQKNWKHSQIGNFIEAKENKKGKLPIICFNCNEAGYIVASCPKKLNSMNEDKYKGRKDDSKKGYKDKGKKVCYIVE